MERYLPGSVVHYFNVANGRFPQVNSGIGTAVTRGLVEACLDPTKDGAETWRAIDGATIDGAQIDLVRAVMNGAHRHHNVNASLQRDEDLRDTVTGYAERAGAAIVDFAYDTLPADVLAPSADAADRAAAGSALFGRSSLQAPFSPQARALDMLSGTMYRALMGDTARELSRLYIPRAGQAVAWAALRYEIRAGYITHGTEPRAFSAVARRSVCSRAGHLG